MSGLRKAAAGQHVYVIVGERVNESFAKLWSPVCARAALRLSGGSPTQGPLPERSQSTSDWLKQRAAVVALVERDPARGHRGLLEMFGPDEPILAYQLEHFAMADCEAKEHQVL